MTSDLMTRSRPQPSISPTPWADPVALPPAPALTVVEAVPAPAAEPRLERAQHNRRVGDRRRASPPPPAPEPTDPAPALAWTVALMAHEIRAPIAAVRTLTDLLDTHWHGHIPPGGLSLWTALQSETERLHALAESLVDLASAEYARPVKALVNLDALVGDLVEQLGAEYPLAEVSVSHLGCVQADERLITCLWRNLLSNAFKYSQRAARPRVAVRARDVAGKREFSIVDNGIGIPVSALDSVFQPFQRSDRSRAFDGHGLGLPAARAIARAHGGEVWAVERVAPGAEVRFSVRDNLFGLMDD